jgi:pimeloyl-ACP methyl ester carboxylesterase
VLGSEIRKRLPSAGILSLDARGHGLTTTASASSKEGAAGDSEQTDEADEELDLTLPTLAADLLAVITLTPSAMHWPALPPIILIGHSLGGAVVTELACSLSKTSPTSASTTKPTRFPTTATPHNTMTKPRMIHQQPRHARPRTHGVPHRPRPHVPLDGVAQRVEPGGPRGQVRVHALQGVEGGALDHVEDGVG